MHIPTSFTHHRVIRSHHTTLLSIFDMASISLAWFLTIGVRTSLNPFLDLKLTWEELFRAAPPLPAMLALWLLVAVWLKVYTQDSADLGSAAGKSVLKASLVTGCLAIVATFVFREFGASLSRSFAPIFLPVSFFTLALGRRIGLSAALLEEKSFGWVERVAILGAGPKAGSAARQLLNGESGLVHVVGAILPDGATGRGNPLRVLGTVGQIGEIINLERLNRLILVGDLPIPSPILEETTRIATRMGVVVSRPLQSLATSAELAVCIVPGLEAIDERPRTFTRGEEVVKRIIDVLGSAALLLLLSPLLIAAAILVKATSKGPVLYCSPRVGRGGRHFTFFKFRSMYTGKEDRRTVCDMNEKSGHIFKMRSDPRVTPVGRILRRFSIDETPQLLNVLIGDMSLCGPRPLPAADLDPDGQSRRFRSWAEQRSIVLPGITGLWQINGRSELNFQEMMNLDVAYIRNWSLWLDLKILLRTPRAVLSGRGAY